MNPPKQYGPPGPENHDVRLARIEEGLATIRKHGATKADIDELRVATKADIHELRAETKTDIGAINVRLEGLTATVASIQEHGATKADLKAEIGAVRSDLLALETRMMKWMIATAVAVAGVIVAAAGVLLLVLPRLIPPR